MKIKLFPLLFFLSLIIIFSCSQKNALIKMKEQEILDLAKIDSLNTKISKILNPEGREISKNEVSKYPPTIFYNDRYKDPVTDSTIVKIRKLKDSDLILQKKINFYNYYGKYVDTIFSKTYINCIKTDSLLSLIYYNDQENRNGEKEMSTLVDAQNQKILFNIIDQCGFPNSDNNNKESVFYAFIILLHSDVTLKEKYFHKIKKSVERGDLNKTHLAYFEDKIDLDNGKTQKYGTQMLIDEEGNEILAPIDNLEKVNQRRKKIGLEPLDL